jgi:hypothetical protein
MTEAVSGMSDESGWESVRRGDSVLLMLGKAREVPRPSMTTLKTAGLHGTGCTSSWNDGSSFPAMEP